MGRLVRIEIENFKSYKGHQTVGPFHKFTSIIGPNGSGKSNLMDAISFVLGVNSTHLRSQNLKDMIYRSSEWRDGDAVGTDTRPPRRAYVQLVYQTNQGREIKFMRIVHQNGQSEYRLNDKHVPYAQYNAALEKENILVKAKNFLVFQGDVESVASQNANDLTLLIEQISGSLEFKEEYDRLKLEQNRAIENSAHAFNRKRAVTAEIKQYQEQKKEAQKFERLVTERRELVVQYLLWKLYHVEQKTAELEQQANEKRLAADGATDDQAALETQFKTARKEQVVLHRERTRKELEIKKLKKELEEQRPATIAMEEQIVHLKKKAEQTKRTGDRLKREYDQQVQVVSALELDIEKAAKAEAEYEATVASASGKLNGPVLTAEQLQEYEQLKQQADTMTNAEQIELQRLERQQKMEQENFQRLETKVAELKTRQTQLLSELEQVQEHGTALTTDGQKLTEQLEARKQDLLALENEQKAVQQREQDLNEKLQDTLNKLMMAKIDRRESESEAKLRDCLTMMKQVYPGLHGKLSDLCRPTQRKYDTAVATALGRNLNSIVVEDQKTAIECIQYMRDQRIGTATFLPLNTLSVPVINDRLRNYSRGARLAIDVIDCDKKYESVIQFACGNTLVCDTLAIARQICYDKGEDVSAVTLDGTVIHRSGLITGGQGDNQTQTRWKDHDIDGLMRTRDSLLAELNHLSKTKRMGSAQELARSDCAGLESQIAILRDEITTAEKRLLDVQTELRHIEGELAGCEAPYQQISQSLEAMADNIQQIKNVIHVAEDGVFADFVSRIGVANIREYEASRFSASKKVTEDRAQFAAQRSRLQTQYAFEKQQSAELADRLAKLEATYLEANQTIQSLEQQTITVAENMRKAVADIDTFTGEVERYLALEEEKHKEISQYRQELESKGRDVESYLKEVTQLESECEKISAERIAIFRKCKLEDIDLPLLRGSMDDVLMDDTVTPTPDDSLRSMDIDEPSQRSIRSTDWVVEVDYSKLGSEQRNDSSAALERQFKDEIKRRGDEIENMAPNLKAIDRLDGVEQRLGEVEESFDEARRAAKRAKEAFNKVKQQRYNRFYDAFSHISEKIDQVYKDLTKSATFPLGGTAYLSLEDSDEPYLEGIKYHAMPPMKRFRDMDQLSGGEKSIAALALLFAIHSYQPSPFFVLDEVDAALDNTNVSRISDYIREHASDDFQFIVISLKNTLYEKAQSLVGIYRDQEVNSSKTLTLMLDQYAE